MLTLLKNAHVFTPEDAGICHLLVGGGKVLALAPVSKSLEVSGAEVIDLDGRRLVPGLIDAHAHVTGGGGESGFRSRVPPVALSRFTSAGVTSVVGLLGTDDCARDTRSLVATTCGLREAGLGAWCYTGGYRVPPVTLTGSVRDDIVFIDPILGVGEVAIADHRSSQPTLDELKRIASDAHVAGMIAGKAGVLHLHVGDGRRGLEQLRQILDTSELPARVLNPTHVNRNSALLEEAIDLASRGSTVDITAFPIGDGDDAVPAECALQRFLDAGPPSNRVTVSSDGGGCLPEFDRDGRIVSMEVGEPRMLLDTLRALLDAGMPLDQALPPFTSNVADLLYLRDRGRIVEGASADLLVLDDAANPGDILIGGRWHMRDGRLTVTGRFE